MGVLQRILLDMEAAIAQGGEQLYPILMGYVALFGMLALLYLLYAVIANGQALSSAVGLLIRLALVVLVIDRWPWFVGGVRDLGLDLGLLATGNTLQVSDFLDPGALVRKGIVSAGPMWTAFKNNLGWTSFVVGFAYLAAWLGYVAAYCVMAYKVFWWQVEALIVGLAGMALLPTLLFRPTAFIAGGCLSYIPNMAARFLLGSVLSGLLWGHLDRLVSLASATPAGNPSLATVDIQIQTAFVAVGYAWVCGATFFGVNSLAGVLTGGIPGMAGGRTMGGFLRTMAAGAAGIMTGGAMAGAGVLGVARVGLGAVQGGIGGLGAAQQMLTGQSGVHSIGEAARQVYAGVRSGANTREGQLLGQYMHRAAQVGTQQGQRTLQQLMLSNRQLSQRDHTMNGVRR